MSERARFEAKLAGTTQAEILPTHTRKLFELAVQRSAALLRAGNVVALPTETVYGLAANAFNPEAVEKIFDVKGRPAHNPIIVHVAGIEMARHCVECWPDAADQLAQSFWPGPLTLVLRSSKKIPQIVTAGGPTVGLRWPSHPFIQAVIRECGFPLAAPSANRSNHVSPTNAEHVQKDLGQKISLIVDGGQSQVGIESTVLDLSVSPPRLLRPGMIDEQALSAVVGELSVGFKQPGLVLKSPGMLPRHYAPRAKLVVWSWRDEVDLRRQLAALGCRPSQCHIISHTQIPSGADLGRVAVIPDDAEAFARAIYAELHQCDNEGADWIIVEAVPETGEWHAIADRLKRATTG